MKEIGCCIILLDICEFIHRLCVSQEAEKLKAVVIDNLRCLAHCPGAIMSTLPPARLVGMYDIDCTLSEDRINQYVRQHSIVRDDVEEDQFGFV